MTESNLPFLVLLPLFCGVMLVPALGLRRAGLAWPVAMISLATFLGFALACLTKVLEVGTLQYRLAGWAPPRGIELRVDALSAFVITVIAVISVVVAFYARVAVRREIREREAPFYCVLMILLLGLSGMVFTGDLFNLYVFFEVSSLSAYALMAIGHRKAAVSAYRYLIMGTLGASFYLIGVGFLYVLTGSLNMADIAERIADQGSNPALLLSIVLMVVGLGLKMALFPMHLWLPDAYSYASSTATAIIAPVMTKVSAYVLIRLLYFVYDSRLIGETLPIGDALVWLGLAGVVVGSVAAIAQKDAKRMLAYSSIAQVGYIATGIGLGTPLALIAALLHVLNHAAMKCCLFLAAGNVFQQTGTTRLAGYSRLGRRMPWTFLGFTVAALAMVGLPPTNGFFSKWYLVLGALEKGSWAVVAVVVASGLLTAVYFFRVIVLVYAGAPDTQEDAANVREAPFSMVLPVVLLGAALLALGLGNAWFVDTVLRAALPVALQGAGG